jgi:hypothetical protein
MIALLTSSTNLESGGCTGDDEGIVPPPVGGLEDGGLEDGGLEDGGLEDGGIG